MYVAEANSEFINRAMATLAVKQELGPISDIPTAVVTAYGGQITTVRGVESTCRVALTNWNVKDMLVETQARDVWDNKLIPWYGVARATAPAELQAALDVIDTEPGFTPAHCRRRAEQTRDALSAFPEDFTAADVSKADLMADIQSLLDPFEAAGAAEATFRKAHGIVREEDQKLDKENKRIYQILASRYRMKGTHEYDLVHGIPKEEDSDSDDGGGMPSLPPLTPEEEASARAKIGSQ